MMLNSWTDVEQDSLGVESAGYYPAQGFKGVVFSWGPGHGDSVDWASLTSVTWGHVGWTWRVSQYHDDIGIVAIMTSLGGSNSVMLRKVKINKEMDGHWGASEVTPLPGNWFLV